MEKREEMTVEAKCEKCGETLIPAPARFDGEATFVGYLPHTCKPDPEYSEAVKQWANDNRRNCLGRN